MAERHDKHRAYSILTTLFNSGLAVWATRGAARRRFAAGVPWQDVLVLGIATHKVSRILTTDRVMAPIRSPFVENQNGGDEKPAGSGLREALGELITCPYCSAPWLSLGLGALYVAVPTPVRAGCALLAVVSVSDFLNRLYVRAQHG